MQAQGHGSVSKSAARGLARLVLSIEFIWTGTFQS